MNINKMDSNTTEDRVKHAIEALRTGDIEEKGTAAKEYSIKRSLLRSRLSGRLPKSTNRGQNGRLSDAQELSLCQYIAKRKDIGLHTTIPIIRAAATSILRQGDPDVKPVNYSWSIRFLKRHPEIGRRKT